MKILYDVQYIYNLKTVQIIGILEEIDSFIDQKCTSWKCAKKIWQPPLIKTKSKKMHVFLGKPSLNQNIWA